MNNQLEFRLLRNVAAGDDPCQSCGSHSPASQCRVDMGPCPCFVGPVFLEVLTMRTLGPEPDVEKIHSQVQTQLRTAIRDKGYRPDELRVSFSANGYIKAQYENVPGMCAFNGHSHAAETYLGLPFKVDSKQTVDVLVLRRDGASGK